MRKRKRATRPESNQDGGPEGQVEEHSNELHSEEEGQAPSEGGLGDDSEYELRKDGIIYHKPTKDGPRTSVHLTNFGAQIVEETILDDGVEQKRMFTIEALSTRRRFSVPASEFGSMNWAAEHLGTKAIVFPAVYKAKEHAATAIRLKSNPSTRKLYAHTGWIKIDGAWVFLHGGGALGVGGPVEGVEVHLPDCLSPFVLSDPRSSRPEEALQASLRMLDLGRDEIVFALLAATYGAPLGGARFTCFLTGNTGVFKSELAALVQQHYGADFSVERLPSSWSSTANSIEELLFVAKDMPVVVDDYAPFGSDRQKQQATLNRILRSVGNRTGRQRLTVGIQLRPTHPPRSFMLSTAEDDPSVASLLARTFLLSVKEGDIDEAVLTECQAAAADGLFVQAMSRYIAAIAADYDKIQLWVPRKRLELRKEVTSVGQHRRTADAVANLGCALIVFLNVTLKLGVLDAKKARHIWTQGWTAIQRAGETQALSQIAHNPVTVFLKLLTDALNARRAYLLPIDELDVQANPNAGRRGEHIGWTDEDGVYLISSVAYAAINRLAREVGLALPGEQTMRRRLAEDGILHRGDRGQERRLVSRISIGNQRMSVLHLRPDVLTGVGHDDPDDEDEFGCQAVD